MRKFAVFIFCSAIGYAQEKPKYLFDGLYFADPSAHVFNGTIFIYPSHDIQTEVVDASNGAHFNMKDYHVLTLDHVSQKAKDNGAALKLEDIVWAKKQLWAPDIAKNRNRYYLYFPAKDKNDLFRIGVASSKSPTGPFKAEKKPISGAYSIDPAVFNDNGIYYIYFGGLKGGQLQEYRNNKHSKVYPELKDNDNALLPKIALLKNNMKELAEEPKDVLIVDDNGQQLKSGDQNRRFFEGVWIHQYNKKYYLSYSTGETHKLVYAIGDTPYGPFTFKGEILTPVVGWTTHHSIVEIDKKWYLFYHDSKNSGGKSYLRSLKVRELKYHQNGLILPMNGKD